MSETVDDFSAMISAFFGGADDHVVEATAEALLNSDPRRFSSETQAHTQALRRAVETEFPDLTSYRQQELAALLRCIGSAQTWLRMREEFGLPGSRSGPLVAWAIELILDGARTGNVPGTVGSEIGEPA